MNRQETAVLVRSITATYPAWKPDSIVDVVNTWAFLLEDYDRSAVMNAFKIFVSTDEKGFPPSVGQLIGIMSKVAESDPASGAVEAWGLALNAIKNSTYHSEEEFKRLPPLVQKAVGSPRVLKEMAMTENLNLTVEKSNFIRAYNELLKSQAEREKLERHSAVPLGVTDRKKIGG